MASEHQRMAFGLCNAPATFQRAMWLVLRGMTWEELLVYLDDIIVLGKNFSQSLENLRKAFERFREYNLKLKPNKCTLFRKEVEFLGRIINSEGVHVSPDKIKTIREWPTPQDKTQLQAFLGPGLKHMKFAGKISNPHNLDKRKIMIYEFMKIVFRLGIYM